MTHSNFEHLRNQLRAKDQRTTDRRMKPLISSLTQIQLDNLREKLRIENILRPVPEDGTDGSQNASPEAK